MKTKAPGLRANSSNNAVMMAVLMWAAVLCNGYADAACGPIPNTYPLYGALGLDPGSGGKVNGNNITGSGNAVQTTGVMTNATQTLPDILPASFPVNSSLTNSSATTIAAGDYNTISKPAGGATTFTGGTYHIKTLGNTSGNVDNWTLTLAPGDYFVETLDVHDKNNFVISPAGVVRIYVKTKLTGHDETAFNNGGATKNMQIYLYPGAIADFNNKTILNGLLYGPGAGTTIDFKDGDNSHTFTGAIITGGKLTFNKNEVINYSPVAKSAIGSITTCNTPVVNSYSFSIGSSSASTCSPKSITITARDSSNNIITGYSGTVSVSTSSGHGDWAVGVGSTGVINNLSADDGFATYDWPAADGGVANLNLTNTHADDLTVLVAPVDPAAGSISTTISFRDNVFVITPTDSLGTTPVAGRNHAMKAELWKKDPSSGNCSIDTNYTGNKNLDAWYVVNADHPAGAGAPVIFSGAPPAPPAACAGTPSLTLSTTVPAPVPGTNNLLSVPFSAGVWNFCLATTDIGKYTINLRDDTRIYANAVDITGASNTLTVRPFALAITNIRQGATVNPSGTATGGSKFVPAGDTAQAAARFQATVTAYLWQFADDINNVGIPDSGAIVTNNTVATRFAWPTTLSASNAAPYFTPGGAVGNLTGTTSVAMGSFASGQATITDLAYSEVGSFQMQAVASNYLNTSGVNPSGVSVTAAGAATQIGRFYPDHFTLVSPAVTAACGSGGFTYMDQPNLGIAFTVEARNTADARTSLYGAGYTVATVSMVAEDSNGGNGAALSSRITGLPGVTWSGGRYIVNTSNAMFSRSAAPDGPYDSLQLGVKITEAVAFDNANFQAAALNMNAATTGNCTIGTTCDAQALGAATKLRFGRLRVFNANGSELLALPVKMETQYWNGTGFIVNTLDNCTTISAANIGLGNYVTPPGSALSSKTSPGIAGAFSSGTKTLTLSAPGAGNNGSVELVVNLASTTTINSCIPTPWTPSTPTPAASSLMYLRGQWCNTGYTRDPTARATFGGFKGASPFIYQRENY